MITFTLPLKAVPQGRPRFDTRSGHAHTPNKSIRFTRDFRILARPHLPKEVLDGSLSISVHFLIQKPKSVPNKRKWPNVRPDLDNYLKAVLDAMSPQGPWKGFWKDDGQIIHVIASKQYSDQDLIKITVSKFGDDNE